VVASGIAPAVVTSDPSVTTARYPATEVTKHFRIQVGSLRVQLPAGRHWISVTPVGTGKAYAGATNGANCVGIDEKGLGIALFDRPDGPRFAIAESVGRHFAQGVIILK
jgi:hypothetical protein